MTSTVEAPREATLKDAIAITFLRAAEADLRAAEAVNPPTFESKCAAFAALLQKEQIETRIQENLSCEANILRCVTKVVPGNKYTKVDIGDAGRYMIVNATGEIFGTKAYGVIHKGHFFGTLDTIHQYVWGEYRGGKKKS